MYKEGERSRKCHRIQPHQQGRPTREMATLIRTVKDPRVHGLVSITAVETTP